MPRLVAILAVAALAATVAAGCAAWREPPGSGEALSRLGVAGPPPEPPSHVASDVMLRRSGALLFRKGRYKRSIQHVQPLVEKYPRHFLATAYLGLARWFQGRADDTAALWRDYDNPDLPGLGRALAREAEGLLLLAERLRARRAVYDAGQGLLATVADDLTVVCDFVPDPDAVPVGRALAALAASGLEVMDGPDGVPRDRVRAWLAEVTTGTRADPGSMAADPAKARGLARLMGAEYAVTGRLSPDPTVPGGMRLDLLVLPSESPSERAARLQGRLNRTLQRLAAISGERAELAGRLEATARGLEHFGKVDRLEGLLRQREDLKEQARERMEAGDVAAGHEILERLAELQERIEALHGATRRFRRAALASELGLFAVDRDDLEAIRDDARGRDDALAAEQARLEALSRDLAKRLERALPVDGLSVAVDLPPLMADLWPSRVARAVALALEPGAAPAPEPAPATLDAPPDTLAALDRALEARDQGRWEDSVRALAQAGPVADPVRPAGSPPDDFDVQALVGLEEAAMAEALEGRILDILTRRAGAFLATGGSAAEFDRLAEGR